MAGIHKIQDFMDTTYVTLKPEMDVYKAIEIFLEKGVTSAVVTDEKGKVVGILSEKDCLQLMTKGSYYQLPSAKVSDFMTKDVFCVNPSTDIFKIADMFLSHNFRRIIVTDEDNKMIGHITRRDMLRIIKQLKTKQKEVKKAPIL
ncbi:MAG: CBS domain-containing protein [Caldithrix sp.]|nr:CBS domain-containing protein [Caldithrix sp.]